MNLQNLLESANPWQSMQNDAMRLAKKWEKTGLLEGFNQETDKNNMSLMLENQAKQLVVEQSSTGTGAFFTAGQGEQWAGIALPLVRKVFGQIAAKEFVSVQPMNLPSGLVFFLDFQYGTNKTPFVSGGSLYGDTGSNFGNTNTGGLYGEGRFTYSTNQFSVASASGVYGVIASASFADVNFDANYSASVLAGAGKIWKVPVFVSNLTAYDQNAVRGFYLSGSSFENGILPAFTQISASTVVFFYNGTTTVPSTAGISVLYNKQTADNARGDFQDTPATSTSVPNSESPTSIVIPELNINMRSQAIVAKTKKLKAAWTPEFAQDLNAYQSLDAEAEVTNIMSEYISLEIDLEILDMIIENAAAGTEYWSAVNNEFINSTATAFNGLTATNGGYYNTQGQWFQTLGTKIQKLSNIIHQKTLRGGANFMVVSPTVSTIIESIPGFASTANGDAAQMNYAFGVQKAGQLNSRYNVYKNPYMKENLILLGFRGSQFLETGAVFAPYIPLIMTPLVYDPETFTPRKGLLTRYAKTMVRPEFYGKIYVSGLTSI
jgi:hypothetical protein